MIKCLLTEQGRAGRENIWLSVRSYEPRCSWSVHPDLGAKYFPVRPSHSVNKYILRGEFSGFWPSGAKSPAGAKIRLGYLKDSNAAEHSADSDIFYMQ